MVTYCPHGSNFPAVGAKTSISMCLTVNIGVAGRCSNSAATHDPAQARPNTFSLLPAHAVPTFIGVFLTCLLHSLGN